MEIIYKNINELHPYENNPRKNDSAVEAVAASIKEFGFKVPVIIEKNGTIVAGHTRYKAAKKLKMKEIPCIVADDLSDEQIKAFRLADNKVGELADWDFDLLSDELDGIFDIDMSEFGFEDSINNDWFEREEKDYSAREDGNEEYNEFIEKFKTKKTTDDCYTPDEVYEAIADWVASEYGVNKKSFFCPFYPGGDYQKEEYNGKIVVDNPPFSILAEIKRFYTEREIKFFLFAPTLTLFSAADCEATFIPCGATVTYENGAVVNTSFVTNLEPTATIVRTAPSLYKAVDEANKRVQSENKANLPKYEYPDNILTAAIAARWCKYGVEYTLNRRDCLKVSALDAQKETGDAIFGGGFLLGERAAAEKAAAEKAAAEKAAAVKWKLSERELEIVHKLGNGAELIEGD